MLVWNKDSNQQYIFFGYLFFLAISVLDNFGNSSEDFLVAFIVIISHLSEKRISATR